jgi:hypothetical protein
MKDRIPQGNHKDLALKESHIFLVYYDGSYTVHVQGVSGETYHISGENSVSEITSIQSIHTYIFEVELLRG